jgi:hypothetical protein
MTPKAPAAGERQHMRAVMVPDALWDEARDFSEKLNVSLSELVRSGLKRELAARRENLRRIGK